MGGQQQFHVVPMPLGWEGSDWGLGWRTSWAVYGSVHGCMYGMEHGGGGGGGGGVMMIIQIDRYENHTKKMGMVFYPPLKPKMFI